MRSRASSEKGSAVVGFTMAVALLLFAVLALFSLAITLHVRTVLQDAAAEGARAGAASKAGPAEGVEVATSRAGEFVTGNLAEEYARDIVAYVTDIAGVPVIEVEITGPLPLFGVEGPHILSVRAHAAIE
ncbi:TadE/TadG family type IV pilus assembly protein [Actinobaculum sp. 352]|uniref:TadE/TadG family type IV pilus assembly protein n=1 Tax=Actinobaculum sp. 352 TaxID=2490946 RepID=UPI0013DFFE9B|nr:TadE/TadG family type IV pilus assembly protein [Actinobaculum sp. 352]